MKKISIFLIIQLISTISANVPLMPDILKAQESKTTTSCEGSRFSKEFCKLILDSAPAIIKEKLWVLKNSNDSQFLKGRKFLFYGPSGSGKTTLAQVMAQELDRPLLYINAGKLANEYANSASNNFRRIIEQQIMSNSVLVIDEMDCILGEQNNKNSLDINTPTQVWAILDELHKDFPHVLIIGITNKIEKLPDPVRTRFSQLTLKIASTENSELKKGILTHYLNESVHECDEKFLTSFAKQTSKISIRDLVHIVIEAKEISATRNANPRLISKNDMQEAMKRSLARKKDADNANTSLIPSKETAQVFADIVAKLFVAFKAAHGIYNGSASSVAKIDPNSDLATMRK